MIVAYKAGLGTDNTARVLTQYATEYIGKTAEFEYTAILYGGTADQLLALRQGEVDFSVAKVADFSSFKSEEKVLGVFNTERLAEYLDAPTLGEEIYYHQWYGSARAIVAPKGTPDEIIQFYTHVFKKATEGPAYLEAAEKASMTTDYKDPAATAALLDAQHTFCVDTVASLWDE